jgi:hypothetical protein
MFTCREDLAWAAGLFDGEGSVGAFMNNRPGSYCTCPRASISQKNIEVLDKFKQTVGLGKIYNFKARKTSSAGFLYVLQGIEGVQALTAMLWPWLGSLKKAQFKKSLLSYKETHQ